MNIIAEYSDYEVQTINFFIDQIKTMLDKRDLSGLTSGKIERINVSKEHPLITLMASKLEGRASMESISSSIIPAVSVTPGSMDEEMFTLGEGLKPFIISEDFIAMLKMMLGLSMEDLQKDALISKKQIETILGAYKKSNGILRCQSNRWAWNEEVNISIWSDSSDLDVVMSNLIDSLLAKMRVGFLGDESKIRNMKYKPVRGLTNFNFGRVLYGTEYNLTFLNTCTNYTIYSEEYITDFEFDRGFSATQIKNVLTFRTPGEK